MSKDLPRTRRVTVRFMSLLLGTSEHLVQVFRRFLRWTLGWPPARRPEAYDDPDLNPLYADSELFFEYMKLLDEVLNQPEIRSGLSDHGLAPNQMRMKCVASAEVVLREATAEYAAYEHALANYRVGLVEGRLPENRDAGDRTLRIASMILCATGLLSLAMGVSVGHWWREIAFLWKPGLAALAVGLLALTAAVARMTEAGIGLLGGEIAGKTAGDLDRVRRALLDTLRDQNLLSFVRTLINHARESALGDGFGVTASPGLSEVYDSIYHVPTSVTAEMNGLIDRLAGGSIGVAGPRGSGKSTLVRGHCEDQGSTSGDLRCMVAAPVDYVARDFILHLFATFCRSVRTQIGRRWADPNDDWTITLWVRAVTRGLPKAVFWVAVGGALFFLRNRFVDLVGVSSVFVTVLALVIPAYGALDVALRLIESRWPDGERRPIGAIAARTAVLVSRPVLAWGAIGIGLLVSQKNVTDWLGRSPQSVTRFGWAVLIVGVCLAALTFLRERRRARSSRTVAGRHLVRTADRNLVRVRYLQTSSVQWTGGLKLPAGAEGARTRSVSRAEQPLSYPEIVDQFRSFTQEIAQFLHKDGGRIFIGVDELDKIGSAAQAERLLNEIKGVFGIAHTYFLVSVSDDALTSFERRGLPLRDTFDSSFDEILRAEPLTYTESRRLIYRRVIGLTEPYIAFCHCLSGGLARDLIRVARQVVRVGQHLMTAETPRSGDICTAILRAETRRKIIAATHAIMSLEGAEQAESALERLFAITHRPTIVKPSLELLKEITTATPSSPTSAVTVYRDLTAYVYFCTTLQDIFGKRIDEPLLLRATADEDRHPAHFDNLATARLTLGQSAGVAFQLIDDLRDAWSLPRADPGP